MHVGAAILQSADVSKHLSLGMQPLYFPFSVFKDAKKTASKADKHSSRHLDYNSSGFLWTSVEPPFRKQWNRFDSSTWGGSTLFKRRSEIRKLPLWFSGCSDSWYLSSGYSQQPDDVNDLHIAKHQTSAYMLNWSVCFQVKNTPGNVSCPPNNVSENWFLERSIAPWHEPRNSETLCKWLHQAVCISKISTWKQVYHLNRMRN